MKIVRMMAKQPTTYSIVLRNLSLKNYASSNAIYSAVLEHNCISTFKCKILPRGTIMIYIYALDIMEENCSSKEAPTISKMSANLLQD